MTARNKWNTAWRFNSPTLARGLQPPPDQGAVVRLFGLSHFLRVAAGGFFFSSVACRGGRGALFLAVSRFPVWLPDGFDPC